MTGFGKLLHKTRVARGLTLAQVAEQVGYHPSYLSLVERNLRQIDEEGVVRLAQALELDPSRALLSALRSRLPAELRAHVPEQIEADDPDALRAAARQLQASHFDFEIEEVRVDIRIDWDGNLHTIRHYRGCRPNAAGRPVWEMTFRERAVGVTLDGKQEAKLAVEGQPEGLEYELQSTSSDGWRRHRLFFPRGWRRSPHRSQDAFSFVLESRLPNVYTMDMTSFAKRAQSEGIQSPLRSYYAYHLPFFARRLHVAATMPEGYAPDKVEAWSWWGSTPLEGVTRNLMEQGVARSHEFRSAAERSELVVEEPLAGYSYSIAWVPPELRRYLEARYGGDDETTPVAGTPAPNARARPKRSRG